MCFTNPFYTCLRCLTPVVVLFHVRNLRQVPETVDQPASRKGLDNLMVKQDSYDVKMTNLKQNQTNEFRGNCITRTLFKTYS